MNKLTAIVKDWIETRDDKTFLDNFKNINISEPNTEDEDPIFDDGIESNWVQVYALINEKFSYEDIEYLVNLVNENN